LIKEKIGEAIDDISKYPDASNQPHAAMIERFKTGTKRLMVMAKQIDGL